MIQLNQHFSELTFLFTITLFFCLKFQDGYFLGELMSGQRGLVPSNFVEKVAGNVLTTTPPPPPQPNPTVGTCAIVMSKGSKKINIIVCQSLNNRYDV